MVVPQLGVPCLRIAARWTRVAWRRCGSEVQSLYSVTSRWMAAQLRLIDLSLNIPTEYVLSGSDIPPRCEDQVHHAWI